MRKDSNNTRHCWPKNPPQTTKGMTGNIFAKNTNVHPILNFLNFPPSAQRIGQQMARGVHSDFWHVRHLFFFRSVLEVKNQQHASSSSSPSSAPFSFPTSVTPSHFALPHSGIDGQCVMCINVCVTRRDEWPHARPSLVETKLSTFRVHKLLIGLSVYPSNGDISVSLSRNHFGQLMDWRRRNAVALHSPLGDKQPSRGPFYLILRLHILQLDGNWKRVTIESRNAQLNG